VKNVITSIALAGAFALTTYTTTALAESNDDSTIYAGVQYGLSTFSIKGVQDDFNTDVILGRFGLRSDFIALEARLGSGIRSDTKTPAGSLFDYTASIDSLLGLYGVANADFGQSSSVYGLVGVTRLEATIRGSSGSAISENEYETGLSIGVGANLGAWEDVSINLEYISYLVDSDFDLDSVGFGVVFGF
jgi:opacity protein-like surface antigen